MKQRIIQNMFAAALALAVFFGGGVFALANGSNGSKRGGKSKSAAKRAHTKIVRITVDGGGFSPASFEVEKNHPVTLVFKRTEDVACGKEVRIPSLGIRKALPLGKEVVVKFTPRKTGNIAFTCGMKMMKGSIVVVEPDV